VRLQSAVLQLTSSSYSGMSESSRFAFRNGRAEQACHVPHLFLVSARHGRRNPAARRESSGYAAALRLSCGHEIIQQAIDQMLVKNSFIAKALQVELERL